MSTLPDNEFDLEKLFLPAWAQESSATKYAHYEGGGQERTDRPERRGPRPPRRDGGGGFGGPRREARGGGDRRGPRPEGDRGRGPQDRNRPGEQRGPRRDEPRRDPIPLPEINVSLIPEPKGVESLARQIRMTGRAYPLFDIALMILQKPERHLVSFSVKKNAEGKPVQPLFICALDDTLWLSEDEAVAHVLQKHFATFYQSERTATEPPKGKYTFVGQCGISGVILGPPNYHDYQTRLHKLHAERFSRMPFEVYKSRVRIVRDEEVVKKWVEEQSWKTEYICLNLPEPLKLDTMEAVENHFRQTHKEIIIKPVESHTLGGQAARNLRSPQLTRLVRQVTEDQRRFPLQIATVLSQQFAGHGLQFFKVNKTVTHVSVARPHFLDMEATPVSESVKNIVKYINEHPRCTRRLLVEALAPTPAAPAAPATPPAQEGAAPAAETPAAPAPAAQATPEQTAVISDLHWLIHQGHVIEFANGALETAKKPLPKPPKPEKAPKPEAPAQEGTTPTPATEAPDASANPTPSNVPAQDAPQSSSGNEPRLITDPGAPAPSAAEFVPAVQPPIAEPVPAEPAPVPPENRTDAPDAAKS